MIVRHCLMGSIFFTLAACGEELQQSFVPERQTTQTDKSYEADSFRKTESLTTVENLVPSDWTRIFANSFSFSIPLDMVELEVQGIDSYVGSYGNSNFNLNFDYGMYTTSVQNPDELIDGKKARISVENRVSEVYGIRYEVVAAVNFEDIGRSDANLSMYVFGKSKADLDTAAIIFRSIRFD